MKNISFLLTFAILSNILFAQTFESYKGERQSNNHLLYSNQSPKTLDIDWPVEEIDLSQNHNEDSKDCKMVIDGNNTIHVIYNDDRIVNDASQKIVYTKKEDGGDWTTPLVLDADWPTTPYSEIGANATMPNFDVAPNGDIYVVWLMWDFPGRILTYRKFDASLNSWTDFDTISQAGGSLESWYFPQIYCTGDNRPIVFWGEDDRSGTYECYFKYYNNGQWSDDILFSEDDEFAAKEPKIAKLSNNKCIVIYRENVHADTIAVKYRIFDETTNTLSAPKRVADAEYLTNTYYHNFEIVPFNSDNAIMGMWRYQTGTNPVQNKIHVWNYNVSTDLFTKSEHTLDFAESSSINQKYFDIAVNDYEEVAFVYSNAYDNNLFYAEYDINSGFSSNGVISTMPAVAATEVPAIAFDDDHNLHIIFADNRFDQNGDGYLDRDILYIYGDNISGNLQFEEAKIISNVFPNPAIDFINVSNIDDYTNFKILDLNGNVIKTGSINSYDKIDIQDLNQGIYFLKLQENSFRFIKIL
jgi:hypothetical protein